MEFIEKFMNIDTQWRDGLINIDEYRAEVCDIIHQADRKIAAHKKMREMAEAYVESIIGG